MFNNYNLTDEEVLEIIEKYENGCKSEKKQKN